MPITKKTVERAVEALNDKAERLGWTRRFELRPGSSANGVWHALEENFPGVKDPITVTKIGRSYREALGYVETMNHALLAGVAEREMSRGRALHSA